MTSDARAPSAEPPLGDQDPLIRVLPPGPQSRQWIDRSGSGQAPMGSARFVAGDGGSDAVVFVRAAGCNVVDADGNRYVDLAAGFGAMLIGHGHPRIRDTLQRQTGRLLQALGDVHPSDVKIELVERLAELHPAGRGRVILGQSGADAITAALKTAKLRTSRAGVIAFRGAYHGLSYGPLAACGLRASYREPFAEQLNPFVRFVPYPNDSPSAETSLAAAERELSAGDVGAVLIEPVLGRGGCVVPPAGFISTLGTLARERGALFILDEIWTGLGRAGAWLRAERESCVPDLICLGKGLGGGLPISACIGSAEVMDAWRRTPEVVHTATFAGAPLACATALETLRVLEDEQLVSRSAQTGAEFMVALQRTLRDLDRVEVRGAGLMIGIESGGGAGRAVGVAKKLLERGYLVSTGGGAREVLVLTPPLNVAETQLRGLLPHLRAVLQE